MSEQYYRHIYFGGEDSPNHNWVRVIGNVFYLPKEYFPAGYRCYVWQSSDKTWWAKLTKESNDRAFKDKQILSCLNNPYMITSGLKAKEEHFDLREHISDKLARLDKDIETMVAVRECFEVVLQWLD